jgi:hypothetical protein
MRRTTWLCQRYPLVNSYLPSYSGGILSLRFVRVYLMIGEEEDWRSWIFWGPKDCKWGGVIWIGSLPKLFCKIVINLFSFYFFFLGKVGSWSQPLWWLAFERQLIKTEGCSEQGGERRTWEVYEDERLKSATCLKISGRRSQGACPRREKTSLSHGHLHFFSWVTIHEISRHV